MKTTDVLRNTCKHNPPPAQPTYKDKKAGLIYNCVFCNFLYIYIYIYIYTHIKHTRVRPFICIYMSENEGGGSNPRTSRGFAGTGPITQKHGSRGRGMLYLSEKCLPWAFRCNLSLGLSQQNVKMAGRTVKTFRFQRPISASLVHAIQVPTYRSQVISPTYCHLYAILKEGKKMHIFMPNPLVLVSGSHSTICRRISPSTSGYTQVDQLHVCFPSIG